MKIWPVLSVVLMSATSLFADDLPEQKGFTWWRIPNLKAALLVPEGWHTKQHEKGDIQGYFITREKITNDHPEFDVGLSLNVLKEFTRKKGKDPLVWAEEYRKEAAKRGEVLDSWERDMGPFKSLGIRIKIADGKGGMILHHCFVVNPKTGTLYFYLFEAPLVEWRQAWLSGYKMMKMMIIDDEI